MAVIFMTVFLISLYSSKKGKQLFEQVASVPSAQHLGNGQGQ